MACAASPIGSPTGAAYLWQVPLGKSCRCLRKPRSERALLLHRSLGEGGSESTIPHTHTIAVSRPFKPVNDYSRLFKTPPGEVCFRFNDATLLPRRLVRPSLGVGGSSGKPLQRQPRVQHIRGVSLEIGYAGGCVPSLSQAIQTVFGRKECLKSVTICGQNWKPAEGYGSLWKAPPGGEYFYPQFRLKMG
jgi:hypothetical protein